MSEAIQKRTGDTCETVGVFETDCADKARLSYKEEEIFKECPDCEAEVGWALVIGYPTGAICPVTGTYRTLCQHNRQQGFTQGDTFPPCPAVKHNVNWTPA